MCAIEMALLKSGEFSNKGHEVWRFYAMVVVEPETTMAAIPRKGEIAGANEFTCFIYLCGCHEEILPGATDNPWEAPSG